MRRLILRYSGHQLRNPNLYSPVRSANGTKSIIESEYPEKESRCSAAREARGTGRIQGAGKAPGRPRWGDRSSVCAGRPAHQGRLIGSRPACSGRLHVFTAAREGPAARAGLAADCFPRCPGDRHRRMQCRQSVARSIGIRFNHWESRHIPAIRHPRDCGSLIPRRALARCVR